MKKVGFIIIIFLVSLTACGGGSGSSSHSRSSSSGSSGGQTYQEFGLDLGSGPANLSKLKMSLAVLDSFAAEFTLSFNGDQDWVYQVTTRYNGDLVEYNLHIDGVEGAKNPGDLRLVNTDGNNRMIGPGTEDACVQFPDDMNTGALFLSPVDVVDPEALIDNWTVKKGQKFLGRDAELYTTKQNYYYGWEDVQVKFLLDTETGAMLTYEFDAKGQDPLYGFGSGKIHGEFAVTEIGPQKIEPVEGCQIPIPIPDDAYNIIILPGVYSYQSGLGPVKTDQFFNEELVPLGWTRDTAQINDAIREGYLLYISDTQTLTVHIKALNPDDFSQGYLIRLYLETN